MQKVSEALCAIQVNLAKGKTSISTGPSIPPQIHELPSNIRHDLHSQKHYLHSNDSSFVANPLVKQSCPISTHNSSGISHELPRRMSAASLSEYVDIDKLIGDIKISPMQNNLLPHIVTIKKELNNLKHYKPIADEVATIELLLQSINNKLTSENKLRPSSLRHRASMAVTQQHNPDNVSRMRSQSLANLQKITALQKNMARERVAGLQKISMQDNKSLQANTQGSIAVENKPVQPLDIRNAVSPIQQLCEQSTSRILYTNFSISDLHTSQKKIIPFTPEKVSEFDENQEVDKLKAEISMLERLLKIKGVSIVADYKNAHQNTVSKAQSKARITPAGHLRPTRRHQGLR